MLHPRDFKFPSGVITTIVNLNGKEEPSVVEFSNTPQCRHTAFFLHALPTGVAAFGMFFLLIITAFLTGFLRNRTPGVADWSKTTAKPVEVEMSAIPASTETETETTDEEQPPPYHAPETQTTETPTTITTPAKSTTPAERFVFGTFLLLVILTSLVLMALCIQNVLWCPASSSSPLIFHFFLWGIYALLLLWASIGCGCWVILVRDLWGPHAKKKFPVNECFIPLAICVGIGCIFAFPVYPVYKGAVWAVEACQRRCCGVAEVDGDEDGLGARDGDPDSEESRRLVAPDPDRDVVIGEENEDVAFLMAGSKA